MASAKVTLDVAVTPVEVYGGQSIASLTQSLYLPTAPNGTVTLQIQVHNVRWDGQASVRVNKMTTTVIDNTNCPVPNAIADLRGGITGGFDVVTCKRPYAPGFDRLTGIDRENLLGTLRILR